MQTWDYNAFAVGPVLALLEQIFYRKIMIFFWKNDFFWMYDKSARLADNNKKMLGEIVYNLF